MRINLIDFSNNSGGTAGVLSQAATAPQAWILPDKTGTIALTSDIAGSSPVIYSNSTPVSPVIGTIWVDTLRTHPQGDRWIWLDLEGVADWWSDIRTESGGRAATLSGGATYSVGVTSPTYSANTIYILATQFRGRAGAAAHSGSSHYVINAGYYSGGGVYVNLTSHPLGNTSGLPGLAHRWLSSNTPYLLTSTAAFFGVTLTPIGTPELLEFHSRVVYRVRRT